MKIPRARLATLAVLVTLALPRAPAAAPTSTPPNIVLIFVDNLGNGDVGFGGSTLHRTPHLDRMAAEGTIFTSFYVASGVCTPSRAALMTGCYPRRVNLHRSGAGLPVLRPLDTRGLHPDETTMAETLRAAGYATGIFGKWHLGDQPAFLPTRQGFDAFFGIPYSDDMTPGPGPRTSFPELPLMRDEKVIEAPVDRDHLVRRCTEEAIAFMERNAARPFLVYLPHTMPGSTAHPFSSPAFRGRSRNGAYGDAVEELDWSAGEILATLRRLGIDERTLVIWTSDNGAVRRNPPQGSCAPYKGWGYDTSEGAMRMPCVMRWPGRIPAGRVTDEVGTTLDLLPTFARLAGAPPPAREIDGHDISGLLLGTPGVRSPWDEKGFCFYFGEQLQAVRSGPWKLYLPLEEKILNLRGERGKFAGALYDVRNDVREEREAMAANPEVGRRLTELAARTRRVIGDTGLAGSGQRPAGHEPNPVPLRPAPRGG